MIRRFGPLALVLEFLTDLVLTLIAVKVAEQLRLHIVTTLEQRGEVFASVGWEVYVLVLGIWPILFLLLGVYESGRRTSLAADLGSLWLAIFLSMMVLASLFYLLANDPRTAPSRLFFGYFFLVDLTLLTSCHIGFDSAIAAMRRHGRHLRRVLLIGGGVRGRHVAVRLRGRETEGLLMVGYLCNPDEAAVPDLQRLGTEADLLDTVNSLSVDEVVIALPATKHLDALRMTSDLQERQVQVRIMPDVFEMVAMKARVEDLFGLPLVSITEPSITATQARVKRAFDVSMAALLLLLVSPIMAAIAVAVRMDSAGPIFIHQRRVGAGGTVFPMHKFRSMQWRPDDLDTAYGKRRDDPRVTRVGRYIRRASLDELPQLWNVLVGEMSLVGPRPELPAIVESYEPWQRKRFNVPPGMTGWWQVNGRSERSMHMNTEIDLFYVQNYSILLDLQILARTLGAVIKGKGAF
ncbi:MAG: sugar transferase [Chloroflexota bacterium]